MVAGRQTTEPLLRLAQTVEHHMMFKMRIADLWDSGQWMQNVLEAEALHVVVGAASLLTDRRAGSLEQQEIA